MKALVNILVRPPVVAGQELTEAQLKRFARLIPGWIKRGMVEGDLPTAPGKAQAAEAAAPAAPVEPQAPETPQPPQDEAPQAPEAPEAPEKPAEAPAAAPAPKKSSKRKTA